MSARRCVSPETVASSPRAAPCPARRPWRGAPGFPGDVGNGRGMEVRQGAIRIFSRTAKPACVAVPRGCGREAARAPRLRREGPLPRRPLCSFLATAVDPSPKLRGRGVVQSLLLSWFFSATPLSCGAPRDSPFRLHLMRDPVNLPLAPPRRGTRRISRAPRLCKNAHQVFVEAGSGALPASIIAGR